MKKIIAFIAKYWKSFINIFKKKKDMGKHVKSWKDFHKNVQRTSNKIKSGQMSEYDGTKDITSSDMIDVAFIELHKQMEENRENFQKQIDVQIKAQKDQIEAQSKQIEDQKDQIEAQSKQIENLKNTISEQGIAKNENQ